MELSYHSTEETFGVFFEDKYYLVLIKFLDPDFYRDTSNVFVRVIEVFKDGESNQTPVTDEAFVNKIVEEVVKTFPYKFEHKVGKPGIFHKAMDWLVHGPKDN